MLRIVRGRALRRLCFSAPQIESLAQEGRSRQEAGRWHEAVAQYRDAVLRYPGFAEFDFQLAECLMHEGDRTEAALHYAQALESDGLPVRMIAPWRQMVAEVAGRHEIPFLNTDDVLRPHTKAGILDRSVFLDYVHPNLPHVLPPGDGCHRAARIRQAVAATSRPAAGSGPHRLRLRDRFSRLHRERPGTRLSPHGRGRPLDDAAALREFAPSRATPSNTKTGAAGSKCQIAPGTAGTESLK